MITCTVEVLTSMYGYKNASVCVLYTVKQMGIFRAICIVILHTCLRKKRVFALTDILYLCTLARVDLGEEVIISKKLMIIIHQKLNSPCTRRVKNLIIVCQYAVLGVPRLCCKFILVNFPIFVYFLA